MSATDGLDPTRRFSDRVADYARARPGYPDALVELLLPGPDQQAVVADIGSGTGLSAEPFVRRGHTVFCVEPNPHMRAAAEAHLGGYPGFHSVDGAAEATTLDDHSVDLALVAQAFHWFDTGRTRAELDRILRHDARIALAWNTRRVYGSSFLEGYEALLQEFGTDYERVSHRTQRLMDEVRSFFHDGCQRHVLENGQALDLEQLGSRIRSASYMPPQGGPRFGAMMTAVADLFGREARRGVVRLEYDLEVFVGPARPQPTP